MKIFFLIFILLLSGCSLSNDLLGRHCHNDGKCIEVIYLHTKPSGVYDYDRRLTFECKYMGYDDKHYTALGIRGRLYGCVVIQKGRGGRVESCKDKEKVSEMKWDYHNVFISDGTGGTFIKLATGNHKFMTITPNILPNDFIDGLKEVSK